MAGLANDFALRLATDADWPFIDAWRTTHFLEMAARQDDPRPITGQKDPHGAVWLVVAVSGRPVACCSYLDFPDAKVRRVFDLYTTPGKTGVSYGLSLGRIMEDVADILGYEIRCNTDPENTGFLRVLKRRGYQVAAIELKREANHGGQ